MDSFPFDDKTENIEQNILGSPPLTLQIAPEDTTTIRDCEADRVSAN